MACDNGHMNPDMILEPGLIMIFAHGVEWHPGILVRLLIQQHVRLQCPRDRLDHSSELTLMNLSLLSFSSEAAVLSTYLKESDLSFFSFENCLSSSITFIESCSVWGLGVGFYLKCFSIGVPALRRL
jgi:hypothetical protein